MQEQMAAKHLTGMKWLQTPFIALFRNVIMLFLVSIASSALLSSSFALPHWPNGVLTPSVASQTVSLNGANRWVEDRQTTAPTFDFSLPAPSSQALGVSPLFAHYYSIHSGASSLGVPLTVASPTEQGWIQFF